MYATVSKSEIIEAFHRAGRGSQFTHEGLEALCDHLNEIEDETGVSYVLDVVGLCCDFEEQTADNTAYNYGLPSAEPEAVRAFLEERGLLIAETANGTFLYRVEY